ncbi:hypothetical protein HQ584_12700, partial [Patescibacteria group bacterium]|nr:hypothetical protein [Patescibacteria group bacterium]
IGLSTKEIVEDFNNPLNALLIFKWGESGDVLKNRIPQLGFKSVGSGVHILPPIKTPKLKDKYDIEQWVKKNLLKDLGNSYEYVVVFAQLIDLRHLYCERKKPAYARGRTLLDLLKPEEIFTPKYLSKYLQTKKNISFEELIKQYGFIFLISKECSEDEIEELRANKDDIISQLKRAYNLKQITINDYAKMDAGTIANVLGKYPVKKPSEVASSMVKEAIFWDRFFKES